MDKHIISNFKFIDYKFPYVNLTLNEDYDEKNAIDDEPLEATVGIKIESNDLNDDAIIELDFSIFENSIHNRYPYCIKVKMIGYFEIEGCKSEEELMKFCKVNGTAIMFPYIRSAITDLTKISNVEPLILPPLNIHKLIKAQEVSK